MIRDSDDGFDKDSILFVIGVSVLLIGIGSVAVGVIYHYENQCDYKVEMVDGTIYTDVKDVDNYTSGMTVIEFHHGPKVKVATAQIREVRKV